MGARYVLGPESMYAEHDKHYPSRSGQTSIATAVANITKPVTKIDSGPQYEVKRIHFDMAIGLRGSW